MAAAFKAMLALQAEARGYLPLAAAAPAWWRALGPAAAALSVGAARGFGDRAGRWRPDPLGDELVTLPAVEWRRFRALDEPVAWTVDIVAFAPASPARWWLRRGAADLLGPGFGAADGGRLRALRLYSTPAAWLSGARADFSRQAVWLDAMTPAQRARATSGWRPGLHGTCVLAPEGFAWLAALDGVRRIETDSPAFADWLGKRLKAERAKALPKLPKVEVAA